MSIRVVAGEADGVRGPVTEIAAEPTYLDIRLPAGVTYAHPAPAGHTAFAYLFDGSALFGDNDRPLASPKLVVFGDGDAVQARAGDEGARFLLVSGKPLGEPIARYGPFVMNTRQEIMQALADLQNGTFVTAD